MLTIDFWKSWLIIKKAKNSSSNKNVVKSFIFSFTILQNWKKFLFFMTSLKHIYIFFHSRYKDELFLNSLKFFRHTLMKRNIEIIDFDLDDPCIWIHTEKINEFYNKIESIRKISPFKTFFDQKIKSFSEIINNNIELMLFINLLKIIIIIIQNCLI